MSLNRRKFAQASVLAASGLSIAPLMAQQGDSTGNKRAVPDAPAAPKSPDAIAVLADHCLQTRYEQLPREVVAATRHQILDTLGIALAGHREAGVRELRDLALEMGGKAESTIWGTAARVPAQSAAQVNATMSHALDYDDTHEKSFTHPAVITVPAALAAAEMAGGVSGEELIAAVAVGTDIACRLALAAQPGTDPFKVGWHNTSLYGYFSSAFVAGRLMGLNREQLISAAGIVLHQAAGNAQAHVDGALTKRMGPGFGSHDGLLAARLSQKGVRGARGVLEGVKGFYRQYHHGNYSRDALLGGLGRRFAGAEVSFKPWPSCRGSHTAADAALAMFTRGGGVRAADVEAITIFNGPGEFPLLGAPLAKKQNPQTTVDAQFSNPWVVAAALVDHQVGLEHFTPEALKRPDLLAMTRRISTAEDASLVRAGGGPGATRIEVRLKNGQKLAKTVAAAKGEPDNPMTPDEFRQKFLDCTQSAGMDRTRALALMQHIDALESLRDVSALTKAMEIRA